MRLHIGSTTIIDSVQIKDFLFYFN